MSVLHINHGLRLTRLCPIELLMMQSQIIVCKYCKRDNFRSLRGLNQHIARNKFCSEKALGTIPELEQTLVSNVRNDTVENQPDQVDTASNNNADRDIADIALENVLGHTDLELAMEIESVKNRLESLAKDKDFFSSSDDDSSSRGSSSMSKSDSGQFPTNNKSDSDDDDFMANPDDKEVQMEKNQPMASAEALTQFKEYVNKAHEEFLDLDPDQVTAIRLVDTLHRKKATLDTYDAVMDWHFRANGTIESHESVADAPGYISRKNLMEKLAERYNMDGKFCQMKRVLLTGSTTRVDVFWRHARDCVQSLLTDPRFKDEDYLFFDNNPLAPPPDELDYISDINTSLAYTETYKKLITDPTRQMLVPVQMYIDGAVTGQFDKLEVTSLKMTLGIFNRKARDREYAWKTLGSVPNFVKENSRGKKIFVESGHVASKAYEYDLDSDEGEDDEAENKAQKAADYHCILAAILESYKELETEGMLFDIKYRGKLYKNIELIFYIHCIKCDTDEADKLCLSYRSRGWKVAQLCRYCLCPTDQTDDPNANYPLKTEPMIKRLVDQGNEGKLQKISQHNANNAWHGFRFGLHNTCGIHGACPMELLHAILLGIDKYVRDCFFEQIGKSSSTAMEINSLAKIYGKLFTRSSDRDMPKTHFANGIQKGKIMAKEFSGVMLVMAAILRSTAGREMLKGTRKKNFRQDWLIRDWILLVETMLQWEAYLKQDRMEKKHVQRLMRKHRYIMYLLKKVGNRTTGMGMKIIKFHAIIHIASDIMNFGVPMVVDTGSNESHHKKTKVAAKLTQKDIRTFEKQTETRLDEFHVIDLAIQELHGMKLWEHFDINDGCPEKEDADMDNDPDAMDEDLSPLATKNAPTKNKFTTGGTLIRVFWDEEQEQVSYDFPGSRMQNSEEIVWDTNVIEFLFDLQSELESWLNWLDIRTEHKRDGHVFRGHPQYRQQGMWNDWAIIDWGLDGKLPGEIWCFVDLSKLAEGVSVEFGGIRIQKGVYAVIESSNYITDEDEIGLSDIFIPIIKEVETLDGDGFVTKRRFYLADVEAIVDTVVVIPDIGSNPKCKYFQVKSRAKWSEEFVKWVEMPHRLDEMDEEEG